MLGVSFLSLFIARDCKERNRGKGRHDCNTMFPVMHRQTQCSGYTIRNEHGRGQGHRVERSILQRGLVDGVLGGVVDLDSAAGVGHFLLKILNTHW